MYALRILKKSIIANKRLILDFVPVVICSMLSYAILYACYVSSEKIYWIFYILSIVLLIVAGVNFIYLTCYALEIGMKNIELSCRCFLNGFQVWEYEWTGVFPRLGVYLKHGLCFEATSLMMMVWKDQGETRYILGKAYIPELRRWGLHSWMEVKAYGIWWAFDSSWMWPTHPVPRIHYLLINQAFYIRKIPSTEFFSHKIARDFTRSIQNPRTSYIFHNLTAFGISDCGDKKSLMIEVYGESRFRHSGEFVDLRLINTIDRKSPITQRIIKEFLVKPTRRLPKKKSFRAGLKVQKFFAKKASSL